VSFVKENTPDPDSTHAENARTSNSSVEVSIEALTLKRLRCLFQPLDPPTKLLRFPVVFERLCAVLCLKKREAWAVLRSLESQGLIEIVPFQGIRVAPAVERGRGVPAGGVWRPTSAVQRRILKHLRSRKRAFPSDIARALNVDIDIVIKAARRLQREGLIEA